GSTPPLSEGTQCGGCDRVSGLAGTGKPCSGRGKEDEVIQVQMGRSSIEAECAGNFRGKNAASTNGGGGTDQRVVKHAAGVTPPGEIQAEFTCLRDKRIRRCPLSHVASTPRHMTACFQVCEPGFIRCRSAIQNQPADTSVRQSLRETTTDTAACAGNDV